MILLSAAMLQLSKTLSLIPTYCDFSMLYGIELLTDPRSVKLTQVDIILY